MLQSEPMINYIRTAGAYEWYEKFFGMPYSYEMLGKPGGYPTHLDNWIEMLVGKVRDEGRKNCIREFKELIAKSEPVDETPTEERVRIFVCGYLDRVRKEFEDTVRDALEHDPVAIRETSEWSERCKEDYPGIALSGHNRLMLYNAFVKGIMEEITYSYTRKRKSCVLF